VSKSITFTNATLASSWVDAGMNQAEVLYVDGQVLSTETASFSFANANNAQKTRSALFEITVGCSSSTGSQCLVADNSMVPTNWTEFVHFVIYDPNHEPESSKVWQGSLKSIFQPMLCIDHFQVTSPTF